MPFFNGFPYSDYDQINLDWVIKTCQDALDKALEAMGVAADTKEYVDNYFANLDVQEEINTKIDQMADDGDLLALMTDTITNVVNSWLTDNITNPSNPPLDATLTLSAAAAQAAAVGAMFDKSLVYRGYDTSDDLDHLMTPGVWTLLSSHWPAYVAGNQVPADYVGSTGALLVIDNAPTSAYATQFLIGSGHQFYMSYVSSSGRSGSGWKKLAFTSDIPSVPTIDATLTVAGAAADSDSTGVSVRSAAGYLLEAASYNKFHREGAVYQVYFKSTGLTTTSTPTSGISGPIPVKAGETYRFYHPGSTFGSNAAYLGYYVQPWKHDVVYKTLHATAVAGETRQWEVTIPSDPDDPAEGWIRINQSTVWTSYPVVALTSDWIKKENEPYTTALVRDPLYGLKMAVEGASIMAGKSTNYAGGYARMIALRHGMDLTNNAVNGATITMGTVNDGGNNNHWISQAIDSLPSDCDIYLFDGASNDHAYISNGQITFGTPVAVDVYGLPDPNDQNKPSTPLLLASLDRTTFTGAFEYICITLATDPKYCGAKHGYVFPHRKSTSSWWVDTWKPFIIQTLKKWGIAYLDLEEVVPPIGMVASLRSAYTVSADGTHPTAECYRKFYEPYVHDWLLSL